MKTAGFSRQDSLIAALISAFLEIKSHSRTRSWLDTKITAEFDAIENTKLILLAITTVFRPSPNLSTPTMSRLQHLLISTISSKSRSRLDLHSSFLKATILHHKLI